MPLVCAFITCRLHDIRYCQFVGISGQREQENERPATRKAPAPLESVRTLYQRVLSMRRLLMALLLYKLCVKERPVTLSGRNDETSSASELKFSAIEHT
jgi:hypothetical protein